MKQCEQKLDTTESSVVSPRCPQRTHGDPLCYYHAKLARQLLDPAYPAAYEQKPRAAAA